MSAHDLDQIEKLLVPPHPEAEPPQGIASIERFASNVSIEIERLREVCLERDYVDEPALHQRRYDPVSIPTV